MFANQGIDQPRTPTLFSQERGIATTILPVAVPPGYHHAIRFGANWTLIISPYTILYVTALLAIGVNDSATIAQMLELAGTSPVAFGAPILLAGLFHVLFFVTVATLFAALRSTWPVRASLLLVFGACEMITVVIKVLNSLFTFTSLGAAYVAGDAAFRATFIPAATAADGLHQALQQVDSLAIAIVWVIISLLPPESRLPRPVRWLGWILALALHSPDPGVVLVLLLSPVWLFLLGRWLKRLTAAEVV